MLLPLEPMHSAQWPARARVRDLTRCTAPRVKRETSAHTGRGDPYPLAPLCKGSCHEVTEGLPGAATQEGGVYLLLLPLC